MWTHIETAASDGSRLDLYERGGVFMIRADGWELMNGAYHASEDQLGRLAGRLPGTAEPAILLGGLGLGYTLASLLETLQERFGAAPARVTVAERSGAVLRWFGSRVNPGLAAALPAGVRLVESDVMDWLGVGRDWDVIVLDVDNGPEALSAPGNAVLYGEDGLARCRDSLAPSGHLLLWAGFEDREFVARACAVGFSVARGYVTLPNRPDQAHVIYVLSRERLSPAEREAWAWAGAEQGGLDTLRFFDDINVETDACRHGQNTAAGGGAA
jgi:spermidine synthase